MDAPRKESGGIDHPRVYLWWNSRTSFMQKVVAIVVVQFAFLGRTNVTPVMVDMKDPR